MANIGAKLAVTVGSVAPAIWKPPGKRWSRPVRWNWERFSNHSARASAGIDATKGSSNISPPVSATLRPQFAYTVASVPCTTAWCGGKNSTARNTRMSDDFQGPCAGRSGRAVPTDAVREDACAENLEEE